MVETVPFPIAVLLFRDLSNWLTSLVKISGSKLAPIKLKKNQSPFRNLSVTLKATTSSKSRLDFAIKTEALALTEINVIAEIKRKKYFYWWLSDDSNDLQMTLGWLAKDSRITRRWLVDNSRITRGWLVYDLQKTHGWFADDLRMTCRWLADDLRMTHRWLADDSWMTYWCLTDDSQMTPMTQWLMVDSNYIQICT